MTKEDFDAEVYEYAKSRINTEDSRMTDRMLAYRAGAEPREKQIQIDAEQIRALQKQKGELTDKVAELKKQLGNLYEIIKRPYQFTAPKKIQMVKEAEQFLKEI